MGGGHGRLERGCLYSIPGTWILIPGCLWPVDK